MSPLREKLVLIAIAAIAVFTVFVLSLQVWGLWHDEWSGYNAARRVSDGICNIAVVPVQGDIGTLNYGLPSASPEDPPAEHGAAPFTNSDDVVAHLHAAESDPHIKGVMVRIDSLGGTPVASEIIAAAIKRLSLPSISLIREYGTSGGYLAASGAEHIIASPLSVVGSIGITMSYVANVQKNKKDGLEFVPLASGAFKDSGNPNKPLTDQERALFERDLKTYHDAFVQEVAANRNLPVEQVAALADGSSMSGALAQARGLIDELGDQESAKLWLAQRLGITPEEVIFCQ